MDPKNDKVSTETISSRYLFAYRNTPHCYTGESPAKRMFGGQLRNCFTLLKENTTIEQIENDKLEIIMALVMRL